MAEIILRDYLDFLKLKNIFFYEVALHQIIYDFNDQTRKLIWCQQNCIDDWAWFLLFLEKMPPGASYTFIFKSKHDAILFKLTWI